MTQATKRVFRWWLLPFAIFYRLGVALRNLLYDWNIFESKEFDVPIISVGNITVGGTGKTPHIEYLVKHLHHDFHVAVLSRGYRRKTKGFLLADSLSKAKEIGDEPRQIKSKFPDVHLAVDKSRVNGVKQLLTKTNSNLILLDDAFQHRAIKPGLSILLIDYNRPIDEDHFLPVGELREPAHNKRRAHIVIITKAPEDIKPIDQRIISKKLDLFPYQTLYFTRTIYAALTALFADEAKPIEHNILTQKQYTFLVVTGIAQHQAFLDHLEPQAKEIIHIRYPDHHNYSQRDIRHISHKFDKIENEHKLIITTEKDAVRLKEFDFKEENLKVNLYYIPIEVQFVNGDKERFKKQIFDYAKKNKKHMSISHML